MSQHVIPLRTNYVIFTILMGLLVLTVVVALAFDLGHLEIPVAMTIAMVKAVLIMLYFMHLKFSTKLTWIFAGSGTLWLLILISFTMVDFLSRDWLSPIVTEASPKAAAVDYFGGLPDPDSHLYQTNIETTGESVGGNLIDQNTPPEH